MPHTWGAAATIHRKRCLSGRILDIATGRAFLRHGERAREARDDKAVEERRQLRHFVLRVRIRRVCPAATGALYAPQTLYGIDARDA